MMVYVVAFEPYDDRAAVGGFDWFYKQSDGEKAFEYEIAQNGKTHLIRLLAIEVAAKSQDAITTELDTKLWADSLEFATINKHLPD